MSNKIINKLVRDNIPNIIAEGGTKVTFHSVVADKDAFKEYLKDKLIEEATELSKAERIVNIREEIADVIEVIDALINLYEIPFGSIEYTIETNRSLRGSFGKGFILDYTEEAD